MNSAVLDSSAVLAFLHREPGWERAKESLPDGIVSSLILAEVVTRLTLGGGKPSLVTCALVGFAPGCSGRSISLRIVVVNVAASR